ncbi:MAG: hypothetical protein R3C20_02990 [Planctomycetaceae bacterium]
MVVCTVLLGVVSLVLVPSLHGINQQRQAILFRQYAGIELNNLHQAVLHQNHLPGECSESFRHRYPSSALTISEVSTAIPLRCYRLMISMPVGLHQPPAVVSVVIWKPDESEKQPARSAELNVQPVEPEVVPEREGDQE